MAKSQAASSDGVFNNARNLLLKQLSLREILQQLFPSQIFQYRKSFVCPFHNDNSPSGWLMSFDDKGDEYKCFGKCILPTSGGNALDIIKHVKSVSDDGALQWLVDEGFLDPKGLGAIGNVLKEYQEQSVFMADFYKTCSDLLINQTTPISQNVYKWFVTTRQIEPAILPDFPVGAYDRDFLAAKFTQEIMQKYDVWIEGPLTGSIIFFYHQTPNTLSHRAKLRLIGGSSRDTQFIGSHKYHQEVGTFGLNRLQHMVNAGATRDIYVLEGETGTLQMQSAVWKAFSSANYLNVVSRSGTNGFNDNVVRLLKDIGIEAIHLFPDNDPAGIEMITAAMKLNSTIPVSVVWPGNYKAGQDPDDYLKDQFAVGGVLSLQQTIAHLMSTRDLLAKWLAKRMLDEYRQNPTDPIITQKARNLLVEAACKTGLDGLELSDYIKEIQRDMPDFTEDILRGEMMKYRSGHRKEFLVGANDRIRRMLDTYEMAYFKKSDGESSLEWKTLLNATITVDRTVVKSDGEVAYKDCSIRHMGVETKAQITPEVMADQRTFINYLDSILPNKLRWGEEYKKYYAQVMNQDNYGAPVVYAFDSFGYKDKVRGADPEYLSPSVIIGGGVVRANDKYISHIPVNQPCELYDFILPETDDPKHLQKKVGEAIKLVFEELINIHVHHVTLPTLAFVAGSFTDGLFGRSHNNYVLALMGRYQSGKSRTAQSFLNFACDAQPGDGRNCLAVSSTFNATEKSLYHIVDCPGMIDDLKSVHFKIPAIKTYFTTLIQNHFDRKGKARLTKELGFRQMYPSRCGLILTGEAIPTNEGSLASRMLNVNVPNGGYNMSHAKAFEAQRHLLRMMTPHYIAYTQRLKKLPDPATFFPGYNDSDRAFFCARKIGCGLRMFLDFCLDWPGSPLSQQTADKLWDEFITLLPPIVEENIEQTHDVDDEHRFLQTLAQMVQSGEVGYDDSTKNIKVGVVDGDYILIFPDIAITQVKRNCGVEFDKQQLYKNLREMGYVVEAEYIRDPNFQKNANPLNNRGRSWRMVKSKFEELFLKIGTGGGQQI